MPNLFPTSSRLALLAYLLPVAGCHLHSVGDNPYYRNHWCGLPGALPSLDDADCQKAFPPGVPSPNWQCPVTYTAKKAEVRVPGWVQVYAHTDVLVETGPRISACRNTD